MSERRKVVIIGGGFGGLSAAQPLNSNLVDVTLIGETITFSNHCSTKSRRAFFRPARSPPRFVLSHQKNTRVWLGTVVDVDPDFKRVVLADGTVNVRR